MPTKPGTAPGKSGSLGGASEELHDPETIVEDQRSPLLLLSNTAIASEAIVHEELDVVDCASGGDGGGDGGAMGVLLSHSDQVPCRLGHGSSMVNKETLDFDSFGGEPLPPPSVHGASLDLVYYPSSHDDNTSSSSSSDNVDKEDGEDPTSTKLCDLHTSKFPKSTVSQSPHASPLAPPSTLPNDELHASSSPEDSCPHEYEGRPWDSPSPASTFAATQPAPGKAHVLPVHLSLQPDKGGPPGGVLCLISYLLFR